MNALLAAARRRTRNSGGGDPLLTGLVGWYKMDDGSGTSPADSSPSGNTGSFDSAPTWDTSGQKIGTACLAFDGVDDSVTAAQAAISDYPFTLAAWMKSAAGGVAWSWAKSSSNVIYYTIGLHPAHYPQTNARSSGGEQGDIYTSTDYNDVWVHVAYVLESATSRKVYVNGSLVGTETGSVPFEAGDRTGIGVANRNSESGYLNGRVDDARIYNRALSATDVGLLYAYR